MKIKVISKSQLQKKIQPKEIIQAVERGFIAYSKGKVLMPPPLVYALPNSAEEICIKTAFSDELSTYTIKQVSVMSSLRATMNVYERTSGKLAMVISEDGWLTNMRTAAAGAIAEKLFRKKNAKVLGVIGSGMQAEFQIKMILSQYSYDQVLVWNRTYSRAKELAQRIKLKNTQISAVQELRNILDRSDAILMATSAKEPILKKSMISRRNLTIISIGSDMPEKCELDPQLYRLADMIVVDSIASNELLGCVSRALKMKLLQRAKLIELGTLLASKNDGRRDDEQFVIVNLVGIGAQDSYVGDLVYKKFR